MHSFTLFLAPTFRAPDKECPSGERYSDCNSVCEKTCGTLKAPCPELPSAKCSTGCFCDPGLVRKDGRCVHPDFCGDCTCEGYGDPHYKSFDRHNFTFNGECSYVAARHRDPRGNHKFQVSRIVTSISCSGFTILTKKMFHIVH